MDAKVAVARDVSPVRVPELVPPKGRMLLGRHAGSGRVLATEDRERHPLKGRAASRQGSRGSVALIGPTGSGKTTLAASAVAMWDGPAVVVAELGHCSHFSFSWPPAQRCRHEPARELCRHAHVLSVIDLEGRTWQRAKDTERIA